jgi:hypothetical protein
MPETTPPKNNDLLAFIDACYAQEQLIERQRSELIASGTLTPELQERIAVISLSLTRAQLWAFKFRNTSTLPIAPITLPE